MNRWDVTPQEAVAIQRQLAEQVRFAPLPQAADRIAGLDCAFVGDECIAAVVVCDGPCGMVLEQHSIRRPVTFPYIPGLLSFREVPALLDVLSQLSAAPDVVLCDGQGLAHPRRFGLACHLGVILDLPTIGCGKSRLCGEHKEPGQRRGESEALLLAGAEVGRVVRTRPKVRPVYVSVGHRAQLDDAVDLILSCAPRFRIPEPIRLADKLVRASK